MALLRTFLLMSLLTGILLLVGFAFGGMAGTTLGLALAFVMNFAVYWFSDKIVLKMYGAKKLEKHWLNESIEKLAKKAGIPKPALYVVQMDVPNAFATGRSPKHSAVAVTSGLLDALEKDEIEGVVGHELSHIKHRDTLISAMAATIAGALTWLGYIFWFGDERNRNFLSYMLMFVLAPIAAMMVRFAISRGREYHADRGGAEISNAGALASALEKISSYAQQRRLHGNSSTSHMFIINPFTAGSFTGLFSTHPPTSERVKRLMAMAKQK